MTPDPLVRVLLGLPSPGAGVPAGIAARIDVTPQTVSKAATDFATGQQDLADAWLRVQGVLDSAAGMAGTGQPAAAFAKKYQPSVTLAWKAFRKAVIVLGGASLGLTQTANNHTKADNASMPSPGPPPIFAPGEVYPDLSLALPPSAIGTGGSGLPGPLAKLWPNADVGSLRTAAAGWRNAAQEVDKVATWLAWTINSLIDVNSGHDMDAIEAYFGKIWAPGDASTVLGGLSQICTALGSACDGYADAVDDARSKMKVDLAALGIGVTLTTAIGIIATPVTGGASDAGAAAADTAEAAAALAPTFRQLVITIVTTADTLLTGGLITAIVTAITNIPTIQAIETETTDDLEPALEDEMAITEARKSGGLNITASDPSDEEVYAANKVAALGYNVVLRDPPKDGGIRGVDTSDLLINGEQSDIYSPITGNMSRIASNIADKRDQVNGGSVVLNLMNSSLNPNDFDVPQLLSRVNNANRSAPPLSNIIVIG